MTKSKHPGQRVRDKKRSYRTINLIDLSLDVQYKENKNLTFALVGLVQKMPAVYCRHLDILYEMKYVYL